MHPTVIVATISDYQEICQFCLCKLSIEKALDEEAPICIDWPIVRFQNASATPLSLTTEDFSQLPGKKKGHILIKKFERATLANEHCQNGLLDGSFGMTTKSMLDGRRWRRCKFLSPC